MFHSESESVDTESLELPRETIPAEATGLQQHLDAGGHDLIKYAVARMEIASSKGDGHGSLRLCRKRSNSKPEAEIVFQGTAKQEKHGRASVICKQFLNLEERIKTIQNNTDKLARDWTAMQGEDLKSFHNDNEALAAESLARGMHGDVSLVVRKISSISSGSSDESQHLSYHS